jgi:hypothetical protein
MEERGRSAAKGLFMFVGWLLIFVYFNFFTEDDAEPSDAANSVYLFGHVLGTFAIVLAIVYFLILYHDQREREQRRGLQPEDLQRFGELMNQERHAQKAQQVTHASEESQPLLAQVSDQQFPPSGPADERRQLVKRHLLCRRLEHAESVTTLSEILEGTDDFDEERNEGNVIARTLQRVETSVQHLMGHPPECAICLDHYEAGETVCWAKVRVCSHIYHEDCIVRWLESHDECPLCRENLIVEDPEQGCNVC